MILLENGAAIPGYTLVYTAVYHMSLWSLKYLSVFEKQSRFRASVNDFSLGIYCLSFVFHCLATLIKRVSHLLGNDSKLLKLSN